MDQQIYTLSNGSKTNSELLYAEDFAACFEATNIQIEIDELLNQPGY
jgi:hypothetical protein